MIGVLMEAPNSEARQLLAQSLELIKVRADRWLTVVEELPLQNKDPELGDADIRRRSATRQEVNERSAELAEKLKDCSHVILAGAMPLWVFRPDLRPGRAHGRAFVQRGKVLFPIYNPAAVLRAPGWAREIRADLSLLGRMIDADDWSLEASNACMWCETVPDEPNYDSNGVLYCASHWRTR